MRFYTQLIVGYQIGCSAWMYFKCHLQTGVVMQFLGARITLGLGPAQAAEAKSTSQSGICVKTGFTKMRILKIHL